MDVQTKNWLILMVFFLSLSFLGFFYKTTEFLHYSSETQGKKELFFGEVKKPIGKASLKELLSIKGISKPKALAIAEFIKLKPQAILNELDAVKGVGEKTLITLGNYFY